MARIEEYVSAISTEGLRRRRSGRRRQTKKRRFWRKKQRDGMLKRDN